jgi:hypothetical protein
MNSTKQQIEKLQHSTGGSLVAGILADINQEAQQVNAGHDGVKVPAKTDHILIDHWKTMPQTERLAALAGPFGKSQFNYYDSDCITYARWGWSPISGCLRDCPWCFARPHALRWFKPKFEPAFYPRRLQCPQHTKVPAEAATDISYKNVFACSMADLFGPWVPDDLIEMVLAAAAQAPQWNFLFLTKYPRRLLEFEFPDNAWVGATVNTQARVAEAEEVFQYVKARVKWLSCEPMLERLTFTHLDRFQWVVIGGTIPSTKKAEAFTPPLEWVLHLRTQAQNAGCKVYEENLNGLEFCREFPASSADPATIPNYRLPEMINLKTIPFTDMTLKSPATVPLTPTANDQTLEAEEMRRAACAAMTTNGIQLSNWAHRILAYKLGVFFYTDKRRTRVSQVLVEGLQAIAPLFEVNTHLKYRRFVNLFDAYGWRATSVYDLRQLGRGRSDNARPFSKRQVRFILDELEFTGFLEHKEMLDPVKRRKQLFIRFRPDRVQQAIRAVRFLSQTEADVAAEVTITSEKTMPSMGINNQ